MKVDALLLVPICALQIACSQRIEAESSQHSGDAPVASTPPAPAIHTQEPSATYQTTLYSEHDAEITARTDGVIRSIAAELGDAVGTGAVLAQLESERELAALQSAQAAWELARGERARASALRTTEMITQAELEAAIYREKAAEAAARTAQVDLGYTRVRAPFRGRIAQRFIRVGQTVRVGDPLFRVTAPAPLRAALRIPEQQVGALTTGAEIALAGEDGSSVSGRIVRVSPTVDPASGTIEVLVDVPQPRTLRPGSAVRLLLGDTGMRKAVR